MKKHIGILGSGVVGTTLANGLSDVGYKVTVGNRSGSSIENWGGNVLPFSEVVTQADIVILAVKGSVAEEVVRNLKSELAGKTVIDTTNPIADGTPEEGVIPYFTSLDESLMEHLQQAAPQANFVKALNSVGNAHMVKPQLANEMQPAMFICGNDAKAKQETTAILAKLGWSAEDFGGVKSARAIEPLCILWCIPGMLRNEWSHVITLLKTQ